MGNQIDLFTRVQTEEVTNDINTTKAFELHPSGMASVIVPTGTLHTSFDVYGSHDGATYVRHQDDTPADFALAVAAGKGRRIPAHVMCYGWLKFVGNNGAAGPVILVHKSGSQ